MNISISPRLLYGIIAVLLVVAGAVGYVLWRDSQTRTIEFSVGDGGVEIREN